MCHVIDNNLVIYECRTEQAVWRLLVVVKPPHPYAPDVITKVPRTSAGRSTRRVRPNPPPRQVPPPPRRAREAPPGSARARPSNRRARSCDARRQKDRAAARRPSSRRSTPRGSRAPTRPPRATARWTTSPPSCLDPQRSGVGSAVAVWVAVSAPATALDTATQTASALETTTALPTARDDLHTWCRLGGSPSRHTEPSPRDSRSQFHRC